MQIEGMAELTPLLIEPIQQNFHPWQPEQWPPQTPPRFTPA
jgi:hypothetical protein